MASDVSQRARECLAREFDGEGYAGTAIRIRRREFVGIPSERAIKAMIAFEAEIRAEAALPPILIDPTGKSYPTDERPMTVAEFEAVIRADATAIERERCALVAEDELCEIFEDSPDIDSVCNMVVREIAAAIRQGPTP